MASDQKYGGRCGPEAKFSTLKSSDGHEFIMKKVVLCSSTIGTMLTGQFKERERNEVIFPEICADVLQKVCHYLTYKKKHSGSTDAIPSFEVDPRIASQLCLLLPMTGSIGEQSELWGLSAFPDYLPGVTQLSLEKKARIFVKNNVSEVHQLYLSRYPSCTYRLYNMTNLTRIPEERSIVAQFVDKKPVLSVDQWPHPYFVCTGPKGIPMEKAIVDLELPSDGASLAFNIVFYVIFLVLSAIFTGLHLSMMSLKIEILELVHEFDEDEKKRDYAADILTIRRNENFLLCTLLCCNTCANTISTVLLDAIFRDLGIPDEVYYAIPQCFILLVFCEVMPQVICSTKYALFIASTLRPVTFSCMMMTAVLTYPLSLPLDFIIRKDKSSTVAIPEPGYRLTADIDKQLVQAIKTEKLKTLYVKDILQPIGKVLLVSDKCMIDMDLRDTIQKKNRTRIPVYSGDDKDLIVGVLNFKDLLMMKDDFPINVGEYIKLWNRSSSFRYVNAKTPIVQCFQEMKKGISLALVFEYCQEQKKNILLGMFTLEDIMEVVTGDMYDEFDNRRRIPQSNPNSVKKTGKNSKETGAKNTVAPKERKEKSAPKKLDEKKMRRTDSAKPQSSRKAQ